jgi:hypothetical protein
MQLIAAYLGFVLIIVALGLSIISIGVLSIALYEGTGWIWSQLYSRTTARKDGSPRKYDASVPRITEAI